MPRQIKITDEAVGKRLDVFVTELLPMLSRAYVTRLIVGKRVIVNSESSKPGYKLKQGDKLKLDFDPDELEVVEDIDLEVIYQDDNVIVINKPPGVISHSRGRYWNEPSVASFVRQVTGQGGDRPGIVHRLDRATSGVMICAKNPAALAFLQKQFSTRKVKKTYLAIVSGHLSPAEARIDMPIQRNPKKPQLFRVGPNGKQAVTNYRVITSYNRHDKLELIPETGRTHQLRVHLKEVGHPILGDELYNGDTAERLLLHAYSLEITLPDGKREVFVSQEPPEMREFSDG